MRRYIVIVSPSYGGAEKRFFDIFTCLRRSGDDVVLIAPSSLVDQLRADHPDRHDVFAALVPVALQTWRRLRFVHKFRKLLQTLPRSSSFHYPMNCLWPLHLGRGDKVSMSVTNCTRVPGPFSAKGTDWRTWLAFFFVTRIDVLSPAIFSAMRGYRTAKKMSLTPGGTFLVPSPSTASRRSPTVLFLGRLVAGKGVDDFLDVLPHVWTLLRERAPQDVSFQIAGYGELQTHVTTRVAALARSGVPVLFVGYAVAQELLPNAAVVLSMQEYTNYPSRVVAEALVAGCGVIVRDTGDSREFGDDLPGLVYCHAQLNARELADKLALLLHRIMLEPKYSDAVRDSARERFGSKNCIDYFRDVMFGEPA